MPRRTKTSMKLASSDATTRSQARARCAPIPAAVPLTAATTGFWQSRTAATSRWAPSASTRMTVPGGGSVSGSACSIRGWGGLGGAEVGPGAEVLAGGGDDHGAHLGVEIGLVQEVDQGVALVRGECVAGV